MAPHLTRQSLQVISIQVWVLFLETSLLLTHEELERCAHFGHAGVLIGAVFHYKPDASFLLTSRILGQLDILRGCLNELHLLYYFDV